MNHLLFDDTAILALGAGHHLASSLLVASRLVSAPNVYLPALGVAAAEMAREGAGAHAVALEEFDILPADGLAALRLATLVTDGVAWPTAQVIVAARPSLEFPSGLTVVSTGAERYDGAGVRVYALGDGDSRAD
ncbi:hypothetical protein [Streptomyces oceani]|uniref:hypothetical protein n=1 Tax=Streptomyces oceani TaxID=1075402 RepID=UPI000871F8B4|nr:hypothetical protein [Streptomyces oceani]